MVNDIEVLSLRSHSTMLCLALENTRDSIGRDFDRDSGESVLESMAILQSLCTLLKRWGNLKNS